MWSFVLTKDRDRKIQSCRGKELGRQTFKRFDDPGLVDLSDATTSHRMQAAKRSCKSKSFPRVSNGAVALPTSPFGLHDTDRWLLPLERREAISVALNLLDLVNVLQQPQVKKTGDGEMAGILGKEPHHGAELYYSTCGWWGLWLKSLSRAWAVEWANLYFSNSFLKIQSRWEMGPCQATKLQRPHLWVRIL